MEENQKSGLTDRQKESMKEEEEEDVRASRNSQPN